MPSSEKNSADNKEASTTTAGENIALQDTSQSFVPAQSLEEKDAFAEESPRQEDIAEPWPDSFDTSLAPFLSESLIAQLKQMYLEGPEPPFVSDSGWAGRKTKISEGDEAGPSNEKVEEGTEVENTSVAKGNRGKRGRGRGRRGRGGEGGRGGPKVEDTRKVVSEVRSLLPKSYACSYNYSPAYRVQVYSDRSSQSHPRVVQRKTGD